MGRVMPAPEQSYSEQQNIEPVHQQCHPIVNELRQQRSRERDETDGTEKCNMNPGKIAVGTGEVIELGLLADPEDAESHHAHEEDQEPRGKRQQNMAEVMFRMD